jgi:hypothetical protein
VKLPGALRRGFLREKPLAPCHSSASQCGCQLLRGWTFSGFSPWSVGERMLSQQQLRKTLVIVLNHVMPACAQIEYRLVGTGSALLQGVPLPAGDVDILVRERENVDAFGAALASFKCRFSPAWLPEERQYYADYGHRFKAENRTFTI